MPLQFTTAWNDAQDPFEAGQEAGQMALDQMGEESCGLALTFASAGLSLPSTLEGIASRACAGLVVGCSTGGFVTPEGIQQRAVAVALMRSPRLQFIPAMAQDVEKDPEAAGREMATTALSRPRLAEPRLLLMFGDCLRGDGEAVVRGASSVLGDVPIVGGLATAEHPQRVSNQFIYDRVVEDSLTGVLICGDLHIGIGSHHGWRPISRPRRVTRAVGSCIIEIDGEPADRFYRGYLGEHLAFAPERLLPDLGSLYPIGYRPNGADGNGLSVLEGASMRLRAARGFGSDGSVLVTGEVPEGADIQIMMGRSESVLTAARLAAKEAVAALGETKPRAALIFSSVARNRVLARKARHELMEVTGVLGWEVPKAFVYLGGQFAPAGPGQPSVFHDDSIVVVVLGSPPDESEAPLEETTSESSESPSSSQSGDDWSAIYDEATGMWW